MQVDAIIIERDGIVHASLHGLAGAERAVVKRHVVPVVAGFAAGARETGAAGGVFVEACSGVEFVECGAPGDRVFGVGVVRVGCGYGGAAGGV